MRRKQNLTLILLGSFEDEPTCGRPLGMRKDKDGYLIVADAYLGLFKVNVATGNSYILLRFRKSYMSVFVTESFCSACL